ncbi:MAG: ubiquinol-cytochrome c reductase iron-sulfur subunit [Gemmatimonadales bacterium]|nr:MAG: ubiquinol-cytochrome c reductase iron-sulfur subunit [Gemmatimonadales bacterium]
MEPDPKPSAADCPEIPLARRQFLAMLVLGMGGLAGTALLVPWMGLFLAPHHRSDLDAWRDVGEPDDFPVGETLKVIFRDPEPLPWAGYSGRSAAWVRRVSDNEFAAFTTYCTHVGCAVRWEEGAQLFMCPCHGGAFHANGMVAAGPPPRPLDRFPIRVHDGRVEIQAVGMPRPDDAPEAGRTPGQDRGKDRELGS